MSGELWEGWEASEERLENSKLEKGEGEGEGVLWVDTPHPEGLKGVGGGTLITTPKGRKVTVGLPPGTLSAEGTVFVGRTADNIIDSLQDPVRENRMNWLYTVLNAVDLFVRNEDKNLLWKLTGVLHDMEMAKETAHTNGYSYLLWTLEELVDLLPENTDGHGPDREEQEEDEEEETYNPMPERYDPGGEEYMGDDGEYAEEYQDPLYEPDPNEPEYHPMIDGGPDSDDGDEEYDEDYDFDTEDEPDEEEEDGGDS